MRNAETTAQATPPYLSFHTFKAMTHSLAPAGSSLPTKLDRTMIRGSNSMKAQFWSALRFFDFIDANDKPSKSLVALVSADDEAWIAAMRDLLPKKFPAQLVELKAGTLGSFKASFGDIGGAVVTGAMRFLVAAAKEIGHPQSAHIKEIPSDRKPSKKPKEPPAGSAQSQASPAPTVQPSTDAVKAALCMRIVETLMAMEVDDADPVPSIAKIKAWQQAAKLVFDLKL